MKVCTKCGENREEHEYYRKIVRCKQCCRAEAREWHYKTRDRRLEQKRQYERAHVTVRRAARKAWRDANPEKVRAHRHKRKYKIDVAEHESLIASQCGKCAICLTEIRCRKAGYRGGARIDHDHKTGTVRGLLCQSCNVGLGFFRDSPETLEAAAHYIRTTDARLRAS